VILPGGLGMIRISDIAVTDFPQPLSPTRPRVSPASSVRSIPSTAFTWPTVRGMMPRYLTGTYVRRPVTSSRST